MSSLLVSSYATSSACAVICPPINIDTSYHQHLHHLPSAPGMITVPFNSVRSYRSRPRSTFCSPVAASFITAPHSFVRPGGLMSPSPCRRRRRRKAKHQQLQPILCIRGRRNETNGRQFNHRLDHFLGENLF